MHYINQNNKIYSL